MQTEPPEAEQPKRKRRWFQFSLRSLMIFTLVCAIPCAWLGRKIERKRKEQGAVQAIELLNGAAHYRYVAEGLHKPPGPDWLRKLLGENFFSEVVIVNLIGNRNLCDADLVNVEVFSQLNWLDLALSINIGDGGLKHIEGLSQLEHLDLSGTRITDSGLERLKALTLIRELRLIRTEIDDAGLIHLKGLTKIKELNLDSTRVTDAGLGNLKGMAELKDLELVDTVVTAAGVESLHNELPNCRIVYGSAKSYKVHAAESGRIPAQHTTTR
jgi:hypothetical protein